MASRKSRLLLWFSAIGLVATGVALWLLRPATPDDFPHPWTGSFRAAHGAFMLLALVQLGYMMADHIGPKLAYWLKHWDGIAHLALWFVLGISGFFLYYPSDTLEAVIDMPNLHLISGLALIVFFPMHVLRWLARRRWRSRPGQRRVLRPEPVTELPLDSTWTRPQQTD